MSNLYFWSDLHLGDEKIAGLRGYDSAGEHDAAVIDGWEATIRARDIVYVLGDLSIRDPQYALNTVGLLPGRKRIVYGNHDPAHPMFRKSPTWAPRFLEVFETGDSVGFLKVDKRPVMMSHFPYLGDHTDRDRHDAYRLRDVGLPLLHGHVHDLWSLKLPSLGSDRGDMMNVGVDVRPTPVSLDEVRAFAHLAEVAREGLV